MAFLMFRTFGILFLSGTILVMYLLRIKKKGKFIKRKAVQEEEKAEYDEWERFIQIMATVGLLIYGLLVAVPCVLDIPYLLSGNLVEVTGEVTQGAMAGDSGYVSSANQEKGQVYKTQGGSGRRKSRV